MLKNKEKVLEYYELCRKQNLDGLLKPLLKSLLVEHEEKEAKDLEDTLNDILSFKSKN